MEQQIITNDDIQAMDRKLKVIQKIKRALLDLQETERFAVLDAMFALLSLEPKQRAGASDE